MKKIGIFGEPLVGFYLTEGKGDSASYFKMTIEGDTSNVALQLAKLGRSVEYISKLGNDYFGSGILKAWNQWNVKHSYVKIDTNHQTGVYFTVFLHSHEHEFVYKRKNSAAANFSLEDAKEVDLTEFKVFHFSGISQAISKSALEASFYLAKQCKSKGILVSYDLNYRKSLWSADYFSSVANYTIEKYADIVTLNMEEARTFNDAPDSPREIVKALLLRGPRLVALKLGGQGSLVGDKSGEIVYSRAPKIKIADTVGAGDAFDAGIIDGLLRKMSLEEIAIYSNLIASNVCTKVGSTAGQPTKSEIDRLLSRGGDRKNKFPEKSRKSKLQ